MKRISALLLALVMALSLAACSSSGDASSGGGSSSSSQGSSVSGSGSSSSLDDASEPGSSSSSSGSVSGTASSSGGEDTSEPGKPGSGPASSQGNSSGDPGSGADDPEEFLRSGPVKGEPYYDLEHVVLYLDAYGELPPNYITKDEARDLGWEGGSVEQVKEGAAIGGDTFGNREGLLPEGNYTECDLNTLGSDSRGAERLVFSDQGEYYYTGDHYETFTQIWVENGEVLWE